MHRLGLSAPGAVCRRSRARRKRSKSPPGSISWPFGNCVDELLFEGLGRVSCNQRGLPVGFASKAAWPHIRNPDLNGAQTSSTQPRAVSPNLFSRSRALYCSHHRPRLHVTYHGLKFSESGPRGRSPRETPSARPLAICDRRRRQGKPHRARQSGARRGPRSPNRAPSSGRLARVRVSNIGPARVETNPHVIHTSADSNRIWIDDYWEKSWLRGRDLSPESVCFQLA